MAMERLVKILQTGSDKDKTISDGIEVLRKLRGRDIPIEVFLGLNEPFKTVPLQISGQLRPDASEGDQGRIDDIFNRLSDAVRSKLSYVAGLETTEHITRSCPGLTKENLYYWERKGYCHPEFTVRGTKRGRIYNTREAFRACLLWKYAIKENFILPAAANMADQEILKLFDEQQ